MLEYRGKYNTAKVLADNIDQSAAAQLISICNQEYTQGQKIRVMPDVHAGIGCVVGFTMTYDDKVCPNLVGVDIGCGMHVTEFETKKGKKIDFRELDSVIRENIPSGDKKRGSILPDALDFDSEVKKLRCFKKIDTRRVIPSLGTLGGGNHFIEIGYNDGKYFLVIHSGSRCLGKAVAEYYQDVAFKSCSGIPYEVSYLTGSALDDYLHDVDICTEYARLNRELMTSEIIKKMKFIEVDSFHTIHNYLDTKNKIIRKGAVSAQAGERFIVPINMRDGSFICIGKGMEEWNFSAPHGAGRLFSRSEVKNNFTVSQYKKEMEGIWTSCVGSGTLDECPMAYKSIADIHRNLEEIANVGSLVAPLYNFKAGSK